MEIIFSEKDSWDCHGTEMLPGWYFWDETWLHCHGPFETKEETERILTLYCEEI